MGITAYRCAFWIKVNGGYGVKSDPYLNVKKQLALQAVAVVSSGMVVGLGSGSTSREFIHALADRVRGEGLDILAVASSRDSYSLADHLGIPMVSECAFSKLDLVVDGADEVDECLRMIKGGGGALFREKILLQSSSRRLILVDESKSVPILGEFGLPLEVSCFGVRSIICALEERGYFGTIRTSSSGEYFITDNGNYIYDLHMPRVYSHPEQDLQNLLQIHGVIEVGFVIEEVEVWVGYTDGRVIKKRTDGL